MRLNYKILWCEDDMEWLEEAQAHIEGHLKGLGFVAVVENVRSEEPKELEDKLAISQDYDIILMDYKFNDNPMGEKYIKLIRDHNIYAEVVFYSGVSKAELYKQIADLNLDGVYVAPRSGEFYAKVEKVIETTIRKVLDVNAMRGIVMAATAETDKKFFEIIKSFHDRKLGADDKKKLCATIIARIQDRLNDRQKKHAKIDASDPWGYFSSTMHFDAYLRFTTLRKEILEENLKAQDPKSEWHAIYNTILEYEDINKTRNLLAHEKEKKEVHDDKTVIKIDDLVFDEVFAKDMRQKLVRQEEKVSELLGKISQA